MISCIFGFATLFETGWTRDGVDKANSKIQEKLLPTWTSGLAVWVPVQVINQGLIPLQFRVGFQALVSYFWDTWLSVVSHH